MKIGLDKSLSVCREEGYLMAEYKVRELYPKGVFNPDAPIRFFAHLPDYIKREIHWQIGDKSLIIDVSLSANDLWSVYQENKEGIDSFSGMEYTFPEDPHSVLYLASDINAYCGLQ